MSQSRGLFKTLRNLLFALAGLLLFGLAAWFWFYAPRERPARLTLTAGSASGLRHQIARKLADEAARRGLAVEVIETAGSEDALDQVNAGRIDVALVQGGLTLGERTSVRQVAPLHVEPFHLLVKDELFADVSRNLLALRGKRVNLSDPGSGTHSLALAIFGFAGLSPRDEQGRGDFIATTLDSRELLALADRAGRTGDASAVPEAVCLVTSLPSPVARKLVTAAGYRLVPLPFGEAFSLGAVGEDESAARWLAKRGEVERMHVASTRIPAFTYRISPPVPPEPCPTLGTRLLVVARADLDARSVERLVEVIFEGPFAQASKPPLEARSLEQPPEFKWHDGTRRYQDRTKPLIADDLGNMMQRGAGVLGAVAGGLMFLYGAYQRWRLRQFETFFQEVRRVELVARGVEIDPDAPTEREALRVCLEKRLSDLKCRALEQFTEGDLKAEGLMAGLLTLITDTRAALPQLLASRTVMPSGKDDGRGRT